MRILTVALALLASAAWGKPWNGIEPGVSTKADVVEKFGAPSKTVTRGDIEILAYMKDKAIRGTSQAQFKVDGKTGTVQRIDVFPKKAIPKEAVESTYGPACPEGPMPASTCYLKKVTRDNKLYFLYPRLGLAVFFAEDSRTVSSLVFQPGEK